jgi:metallo-beta-lactamase class B
MRMFRLLPVVLLVGALLPAQTPDTATAHLAAAKALLNSNNTGVAHLACPAEIPKSTDAAAQLNPFGGRARGGRGAAGPPPRENWYQPPQQVFDNLYYLGNKVNTSWAVKTSAGIILLDLLFDYSTKDEIEDGLRTMGLDPADIKYVIISHAHGDHDGGLKYIQDKFKPHVIMGPKDWEMALAETNPPKRDMDATDGQKLTLGDTTITIYITPGHTGATLSVLVPVKDHGTPHLAFEWGGTALSGRTSKEMLASYISNASRMMDVAGGAGADVIIGNHTEYNDAINRLAQLKERKPGEPNVWVIGKDEVQKYLTVASECAKSYQAIANGKL